MRQFNPSASTPSGRHLGGRRLRGCRHHWIIETPAGSATSRAVCKRCSSRRRFPNAFEDTIEAPAPRR